MSSWPAAGAAITAGSPPQAKDSTSAFFSGRRFPPRTCRSCRWPPASRPPRPFALSPASKSICAGPTICSSARAKPAAFLSRQRSNPKVCPTQWSWHRHQRASARFPPGLATPATSLDLETGRNHHPPGTPRSPAKIAGARGVRAVRSGGGKRDSSARGTGFYLGARPQRRGARPAGLHRRHGRPRRERFSARRNREWIRNRANRRPARGGERLARLHRELGARS